MAVPSQGERIFLLLGSNLGDARKNIQRAEHDIENTAGHITQMSGLYRTAPWGKTDQPWFLNQAIEILTTMDALPLLMTLQKIENTIGRNQEEKWGPRQIDIDILLFGNLEIDEPDLKVPHPLLPQRRFALAPLREIAREIIHPTLHQSVEMMLEQCTDRSMVERLPSDAADFH